jgi:adenosylcobinamide-GDP ribazoletransferase
VHDLAAAIGFLTLLPFGRRWPDSRQPRPVGFYPWVGWLLGALAVVPLVMVSLLVSESAPVSSALIAALVVAVWALVTRFMHWDGLADTFDGIWGGSTPERRLEIMRDSRIGSFGAAAMLMTALVQVTALAACFERGLLWPVVAAPVLGRAAVSLAAWTMPAARREGLGIECVEQPGRYELIVWLLALVPFAFASPGLSAAGAIALGCVLLAGVIGIPRLLGRPVGGLTGDSMGATIVLTETLVLVMGAILS